MHGISWNDEFIENVKMYVSCFIKFHSFIENKFLHMPDCFLCVHSLYNAVIPTLVVIIVKRNEMLIIYGEVTDL